MPDGGSCQRRRRLLTCRPRTQRQSLAQLASASRQSAATCQRRACARKKLPQVGQEPVGAMDSERCSPDAVHSTGNRPSGQAFCRKTSAFICRTRLAALRGGHGGRFVPDSRAAYTCSDPQCNRRSTTIDLATPLYPWPLLSVRYDFHKLAPWRPRNDRASRNFTPSIAP